MEKVAEPGAGPRREAFIKRERTNVAIKTKPTAFVQRWFLPWSSIPAGPRRSSHPRSSGVVYGARNRGGGRRGGWIRRKKLATFFFLFSGVTTIIPSVGEKREG